MDSGEAIARFLIIRRIENKCRLPLTASIAVLMIQNFQTLKKFYILFYMQIDGQKLFL